MPSLQAVQKKKYLEIVYLLWDDGAEEAHEAYPDLSVGQLETANEYYDSLRCSGCRCGSCVNLPELASNLNNSPKELIPIARLAAKLGKEEFNKFKE